VQARASSANVGSLFRSNLVGSSRPDYECCALITIAWAYCSEGTSSIFTKVDTIGVG
jgi:hypothetical protein